MGLVSGLSLVNDSEAGSFLGVHVLLSQDGFQQGGFWEVGKTYELESSLFFSPFLILPVGGGLLVPCSSPGPPVIKQLMQTVMMVPGGFSQCF